MPVAEDLTEAVEDSMAVVEVEDFTVVAEATRAVAEDSPAEVIAAGDPRRCLDMAARPAEAVVTHVAPIVAHHLHKAASAEADLA